MTTPDITPYLQRAIDQQPGRWAENTYESCRDILQATLKLAGRDWYWVGKTADADGPSVQPPGFEPFDVQLVRPDGQWQTVRIVGVSHDAAWHVPSGRQVKVIVNSAANSDERPHIHGPARMGGEIIPVANYRWHNPPISQIGAGGPVPPPPPPATSALALPSRQEMEEAGEWLDGYYASREGLQREQGLSKNGRPDWEGVGAWLFDVYLRARLAGLSVDQTRAKVVSEIRRAGGPTGEWATKHPAETP